MRKVIRVVRRRRTLASLGALFAFPAFAAEYAAPKEAYDCIIEPQQIVKVASPVVGVISQLNVDRNDLVRAGQVLGMLESGVEMAALELARARATNGFPVKAAEARLEFLQRKLARTTALQKNSVSSISTLEEIEAEVEVAKQQLKEAELGREIARLEVQRAEAIVNQRTLRSPINGVVIERLLYPGEYRNEQTPILTIAQIDRLRVEVFVPTSQYGGIQIGDKAEVIPEEPSGGSYLATVTVVDRVIDAASGMFGVRLDLPNPDFLLPAGLKCKAAFEMRTAKSTQE
jgi:RND family efflux transporter MFP subunit